MSQTYTAWNGDEYPWPPPPNWYKASDGRWWAPNSGPQGVAEDPSPSGPNPEAPSSFGVDAPPLGSDNPLGSDGPIRSESPLGSDNPLGTGSNITDLLGETRLSPDPDDSNRTAQQPAIEADLPPVEPRSDGFAPGPGPGGIAPPPLGGLSDPPATRLSGDDSFQPFGERPAPNEAPRFEAPQFGGPPPQAGFEENNPTAAQRPIDTPTVAGFNPGSDFGDPGPSGQPSYARGPRPNEFSDSSDGGSKTPLIIGAVVAGLAILGLLFFFLTRGGDESAENASESTVAGTVAPADATTTTVASTTTTAQETTTTEAVDQAAALDGFRDYLTSVNIVGLDDGLIAGIGEEACTAAALAADRPAWDTTLAGIVSDIIAEQEVNPPTQGTPLEQADIENIYNGATTFYCPSQAERLSISV